MVSCYKVILVCCCSYVFGTGLSFDADISAQIGYMFQVKEGFGISVLGELGYAWDFYVGYEERRW
mgnify:CR=1 FL=1